MKFYDVFSSAILTLPLYRQTQKNNIFGYVFVVHYLSLTLRIKVIWIWR